VLIQYYLIFSRSQPANRDVKRLDSVTRAKIYSGFMEQVWSSGLLTGIVGAGLIISLAAPPSFVPLVARRNSSMTCRWQLMSRTLVSLSILLSVEMLIT
jgi:hypothetical protein